jgi:hypothetical protein
MPAVRPSPVPSGLCRHATSAPASSISAENVKPRCRPPAPSAIQPTMDGPMIWPTAKMMVKALMPAGQSDGGRL